MTKFKVFRLKLATILFFSICSIYLSITVSCSSSPLGNIYSNDPDDSALSDSYPGALATSQNTNSDQPQIIHNNANGDNTIILDQNSKLADYLEYAAIHNPKIESAYYRFRAALEQMPQVTALPDPRFTYTYFIDEVETRVGPQRQSFNISQMLPWFDKLEIKGDIARENALIEYENLRAELLDLFNNVKQVYYEIHYQNHAIKLTEDNIVLLQQFEQIARIRYQAAVANHPDIIRVQVEIGKLEDRKITMQDRILPLTAQLNSILNRPYDAEINLPDNEFISNSILDSDEEILADLNSNSPKLRAIAHEIEKNRRVTELAKKSYYPDITLGLTYIVTGQAMNPSMAESGDDPILASISLNLPVWRDKYDAEVRQAVAMRLASAGKRTNAENELIYQIENTLYNYRDAVRKISLYRDSLIPKAQQSLEVSLSGYQTSKVNFLDLIDTERILLEFELAHQRAITNKAQQMAHLEMLMGKPLSKKAEDVAGNSSGSSHSEFSESASSSENNNNTDEVSK